VIGEAYNIGSRVEKSVEEIADIVLTTLGKPMSLKTYVPDRLQHDKRYLLDPAKIERELGWHARVAFDDGIRETITWYREHPEWWQRCKSGAYQEYYTKYYQETLGKMT
jgi:dTDP-glucose 4,6-dehydratase